MTRPFSDPAAVDAVADIILSAQVAGTDGVSVIGYDFVDYFFRLEALPTAPAGTTLVVSFETSADGDDWAPVMTEALTEGGYVQTPYVQTFALEGTPDSESPIVRVARVSVHGLYMRCMFSTDQGSVAAANWTLKSLRRVGG